MCKVENEGSLIICNNRADEKLPVNIGPPSPIPFDLYDLADEEKVKRVDAIKEMIYENDHGLGTSACEFDHFLGILIDGDYDDE